ncbi:hypothetical protein SGFS_042950 [Streptomyces graminofaciens]|uniref:6-phosphogluconate dehydrogenase n=1 Tax=Streptomyces graminofaciens TaxID=68212 RepID=A0ABM7FAI4_9ACTN|nr:NAD(P)-binding domain-containing protein [Streptomyces graminofaciens]BBC33001.1 hypothetical protein SGFS_042950 [Streptomyces graminofaciens]
MSYVNAADRAPVTVVGLGLMGQALAGALLDAGHPTTVWNRTAGKADRLVERGAVLAPSVGDAVAAGPLVIVCVTDYAVVRELFEPLGGVLDGKVVVNLTTGTSAQARETAEWVTRSGGAGYLDGAVMAVPADIATDAAVLLYSGPKEHFAEHEATLRALGGAGTTYLDTDHGLSALYDLSLLGIMWGILNGFLQGAALLGTAQVKATTFAPLANTMINVVTEYVSAYAPQIDAGEYPAGDATMTVHQEAMAHLVEESETLGVNAELPRFLKVLVDRAVTAGHAGSGYAALIEQFRAGTSG